MSHDLHHDAHEQNVCLTGPVVMSALGLGLAITALIMWWALFAHH